MDAVIDRIVLQKLQAAVRPGKVIVILGPRRTGKSHLLQRFIDSLNEQYLFMNGEDSAVGKYIGSRTFFNYATLIGDNKVVIIDEAQKISGIGTALKFMVDSFPEVRFIVTGSSMFDLGQHVGEPLTGRKITYFLYPFSQQELLQVENPVDVAANLENRLIFGSYPELQNISSREQKAVYLREVADSYLLKDILALDGIRNSMKMYDLLRLLALQVGQLVSLEKLGNEAGMSKNTVERYFDLLSKCFVIHRVQGYSRNFRKEITKMSKWYFLDNGIRNAIIANFNPLALRGDTGMLWENYLVTERLKFQSNSGMIVNNFFWRTYDQQELDWVEERGGQLYGYEFKWSSNKIPKVPPQWKEVYPGALFSVINPSNYLQWITGKGLSAEEAATISKTVGQQKRKKTVKKKRKVSPSVKKKTKSRR